jgi:HEPN domain-containing protein
MPQPEHELYAVDWYQRAIHDLKGAYNLASDDPSDPNAVWLAQQATEKAIKAILILHQIKFHKIHDLERLRALLPEDYALKTIPADLSILSARSMESRYPGDYDEIEEREVTEALSQAAEVIELLKQEFDPRVLYGIDPSTGEPYA